MASVTVDDVRDVIHISAAEISDSKITKMMKRAEVTLELETDEVDYNSCSDAEKEFITVLAAVYAICYLNGGSAVGLNACMQSSQRPASARSTPSKRSSAPGDSTPKKSSRRRP